MWTSEEENLVKNALLNLKELPSYADRYQYIAHHILNRTKDRLDVKRYIKKKFIPSLQIDDDVKYK